MLVSNLTLNQHRHGYIHTPLSQGIPEEGHMYAHSHLLLQSFYVCMYGAHTILSAICTYSFAFYIVEQLYQVSGLLYYFVLAVGLRDESVSFVKEMRYKT